MSKRLLISANMEDEDAGVVDPRFQHGMPWHSQSLPGLAGHSMDGPAHPSPTAQGSTAWADGPGTLGNLRWP